MRQLTSALVFGAFMLGASSVSHATDFFAPSGYDVVKVNLVANDLAFNAATGEYIASVGSAAGYGLGNTVSRIGADGTILLSTFVGSEPGRVEVSRDGSTGYVALMGASTIRSFNAVTGEVTGQINLQPNSDGAVLAEDLSISPNDANTIAVAMRNTCCSPRHEGVAIFSNGVMLAAKTPGHTGSNSIEFGANGSVLYGYDNESSEFGFRTMAVNATGVSVTSFSKATLNGYYKTIQYDDGLIFSSAGEVIDPTTAVKLGQFSLEYGSFFAPDVSLGRAYGLNSTGQLTIFDLNTFTPVVTFNLRNKLQETNFSELIVGANHDLAIRGTHGIYLLAASVPEPSTWAMMGLGLLATWSVSRRRQG
jgi:hypothetical protein